MIEPYYQDELCTIYNADCRDVLPQLGPVDLVLTDPPYGIGENSRKQQSRGKLAKPTNYGHFDWDKKPPSADTLAMILGKAKRSILWGGNYFGLPASPCWLVWDKLNTGDFADCELAWTNFGGAVRKFTYLWNGMLQHDMRRKEKRVHPTQKPLPLMRWCIGLAQDAKTILDPYMGSGTTLVAAKALGVKAVGIEISKRYCDEAVERLRQNSLIPMMEAA